MNAQKLSKRLATVAAFVPQDAVVADIGSDHAYLPCYLVNQGIINKGVAGEVVKGPYESACQEVKREGLLANITVRLANGLEAIEPEDGVTAITIAGMGGPLIASILNHAPTRLAGVERLILQPNIHAIAIREWAVANDWVIVDEAIIKEDGKIYEILVLERGQQPLSDIELLLGQKLMAERNAVFVEKWTHEMDQWHTVLANMEKAAQTPAIIEKKAQLVAKIDAVKGVLA